MATITSNQTGDWDATSTWVGGSVPAADDSVVIAHGHKVTLDTNIQSTRTGDVTIDGNLHFADGGKMHLHGRMTVKNTSHSSNNTGEFVQGTAASGSLLSMVGGTEIKISGSNSDQHGIQVDARKWCGVDIQGSEPTHYTNLNGAYSVQSDYMTVDSAANFAAGDIISLYEREVDYRISPDECFYIHDTDTTNNRIYIRQYVTPEATVLSKSGSTITVDDAKVFRVGYKIIFGTGSNRNVKKITGITGNVITFGSAVSGTVTNLKAYVTGNEKYHVDNRIVRRLATSVKTAITTVNSTNQLVVGDASDLSVGDEIMVEAGTDDGTYNYASGSENNVWRHNILYTISSKSGNTLTLNRNLQYKSDVGVLVVRMTRDIVIKACKTDGTDVPDGDQDSARVFFNVKYWTSNGWNNASTRRVKIKYVRFKNLGYNTNDSTNFRAGVLIGGYNGRYKTDLNGSGADETTIHTSNGFSQTGENYVDGCVVTAYSLCSNTTRDGDSYPSICVRHPYGHVNRNNVACGTGYGLWRWSTGYFVKESGGISMVANHSAYYNESIYADYCCVEYITTRMSEDYGFRVNNVRDGYNKHIRHIDSRTHQSRGFEVGYLTLDGCLMEKIYVDKYRYITLGSTAVANCTILNSRFMPNQWDQTASYYDPTKTGVIYSDNIYHWQSGYEEAYKGGAGTGIVTFAEHGFKSDEVVETYFRATRVKKSGNSHWDILIGSDNRKNIFEKVFVPANTTVKIQSELYTNPKTYRGASASISSNDYPYLMAIPHTGLEVYRTGRYADGTFDWAQGEVFTASNIDNSIHQNSTNGDLGVGWMETNQHTSSSLGAWEKKEITIQPQVKGYFLHYGFWWEDDDARQEGFKMRDYKVAFSKAPLMKNVAQTGRASKTSVRSSFNTGKKRIGGTRL